MAPEYKTLKEGDNTRFPTHRHTACVHIYAYIPNEAVLLDTRDGKPIKIKIGKGDIYTGGEEMLRQMSIGQKIQAKIRYDDLRTIAELPPFPASTIIVVEIDLRNIEEPPPPPPL